MPIERGIEQQPLVSVMRIMNKQSQEWGLLGFPWKVYQAHHHHNHGSAYCMYPMVALLPRSSSRAAKSDDMPTIILSFIHIPSCYSPPPISLVHMWIGIHDGVWGVSVAFVASEFVCVCVCVWSVIGKPPTVQVAVKYGVLGIWIC